MKNLILFILIGIICLFACGKEDKDIIARKREQIKSSTVAAGMENESAAESSPFSGTSGGLSFLHQDFQNMKDPFQPLVQSLSPSLSESSFSSDSFNSSVSDKNKPENSLESLDISSLRLTAVLFMGCEKWALVEEPGGKGHEVGMGMCLGNNRGKVTNILQDRILIREVSEDGAEKIRELFLHKNMIQ